MRTVHHGQAALLRRGTEGPRGGRSAGDGTLVEQQLSPMHLKHVLRQIEPDRGNPRQDRPPLRILKDPPWHSDADGIRAPERGKTCAPIAARVVFSQRMAESVPLSSGAASGAGAGIDPFDQLGFRRVVKHVDVEHVHRAHPVQRKEDQRRHLRVRRIRADPGEKSAFILLNRGQKLRVFRKGRQETGSRLGAAGAFLDEVPQIGAEHRIGPAAPLLGAQSVIETI